jgi:hypothetical protein
MAAGLLEKARPQTVENFTAAKLESERPAMNRARKWIMVH